MSSFVLVKVINILINPFIALCGKKEKIFASFVETLIYNSGRATGPLELKLNKHVDFFVYVFKESECS